MREKTWRGNLLRVTTTITMEQYQRDAGKYRLFSLGYYAYHCFNLVGNDGDFIESVPS